MRKIREVLRLTAAGVSARQVAQCVGVARSTMGDCLRRVAEAGLSWPLPEGLDEVELERRVYPPVPPRPDAPVLPDWTQAQPELRPGGVERPKKRPPCGGLSAVPLCAGLEETGVRLPIPSMRYFGPDLSTSSPVSVLDRLGGELDKAQVTRHAAVHQLISFQTSV